VREGQEKTFLPLPPRAFVTFVTEFHSRTETP
jgi:hypothetical protein